jgi:thioredoxin-like negative regulator of GroEL
LLRQVDINDSNALRTLIALYAKTEQHEQLVELCKAKYKNILALPVSGRLVEQLVTAHLQYYQQTKEQDLLASVQALTQEFLPELERLRQANGVRKLLHLSLAPQEPLPTIEGATLNEQLTQLLEIEPGERIAQLEKLQEKYPKAINILLALADAYISIKRTEYALQIYQSITEKTEELQQRHA